MLRGPRGGLIALLALFATVVAAPAAGDEDLDGVPVPVLPEPTYETVSEEVLVAMDDGVRLAATVVRPSIDGETPAPGRFPVVLALTPYSRNGVCGCIPPDLFASRGMVGVVADVRGTGGSEGDLSENYFSPREARDGRILVDHFGSQEWSSGRVGMAGGSYVGITQYTTAALEPAHLAAIVPMLGISDLYRDGFTHGGIPNLLFDLQYVAVQGAPGAVGTNTDPYLLEASLAAKLGQSPPGTIAFDYLARPDDDDFYRERSPIHGAEHIRVPVLTIGGWADGLLRGQTEMHTALARRADVETRLHMDPCTHKGCGPPFAPFTDHRGRVDLAALAFEFLAHHLLDVETPDRAPVEYFLQNADGYRTSQDWPPRDVRYLDLALHNDGVLAPAVPGETSGGTASYVTDPAAGFSMALNRYGTVAATPYVPTDQRLERFSGATFRSPVLDEPLRVVGPISLHLVAATTATDTDWHAKLADVAPDGTETFVTEGALRASHRSLDPERTRPERPYHRHDDPTPVEPGTFVAYEIEIWPTAYELPAGHRLQVRITSTDMPTHLPGWIELDPDDPSRTRIHLHDPAVNTIRLVESHLRLPVLGGMPPAIDPGPAADVEPPEEAGASVLPDTGGTGARTGAGLLLVLLLAALTLRANRRERADAARAFALSRGA